MKKLICIIALILTSSLFSVERVSQAHDLVFPAEKLKTMYPSADSFEQKDLYVSDGQRTSIEKALKEPLREEDMKPSVYLSIVRPSPGAPPRKTAAMMFIDAFGSKGKIEMGVVVGGDGNIERVYLFENEESPVFSQYAFLGQFVGKSAAQDFRVGKDIDAKGDEKTAQAIASGAHRGIMIINELFKRK